MPSEKNGYYGNISPENREALTRFRNDEAWSQWKKTIHPHTISSYESAFFTLLKGTQLTPTQLRDQADKNPRETSKLLKLRFAELEHEGKGRSLRSLARAALTSFLAFHELVLPLVGLKINGHKNRKPFISWEDGLKIISLANVEYQPCFKFLLWSTFDVERFVQLNQDPTRLASVRQQLKDESNDWIKIEVPEGRKNSPAFFSMVPRNIAALLPILDQSGRPITGKQNIHYQWRIARNRAGLPNMTRIGPHNLRSVWLSEAARRKLDPICAQHQLGHTVDKLSYQRLQDDEAWVLKEFREAWSTKPAATKEQAENLAKENEDLKRRLAKLEDRFDVLLREEAKSAKKRKGVRSKPVKNR